MSKWKNSIKDGYPTEFFNFYVIRDFNDENASDLYNLCILNSNGLLEPRSVCARHTYRKGENFDWFNISNILERHENEQKDFD